ncbi:Glycosyltransferase involved in cell wall bisynthesis [Fibrobacter sp. UWT2]|jgi:glycosyltransferase involved in cell wall biosynthesis|uniref:glycosyltransferase n=1 Tax=Fibrobacter sp. UWT2 TaxID=1896224 RepID=UPI000910688A|nr:glycosyltransferase [Fibrobacter sp. UWT2]SHK39301.1 Glycosyltransferase involved in cell wall bisynthesis [Fibrobacter sp. UWT2]
MAKIGIVLATYNGEKYLAQMLDSLVAQTRPADFIVAVDDGSKDNTPAILKSYQDRLPLQVTILEKNSGHRAAFSKALELAQPQLSSNDLIALADQDDVWLPQKLEILEKEIQDKSLVFGDAQVVDANGKIIAESWRSYSKIEKKISIEQQIAGINNVTGCLSLFSASLLDAILPIPEGVTVHDRWIAMLADKHNGVAAIDTPVVQYRIHGNNAVGGVAAPSMSKTLETQIQWTQTILDNAKRLDLTEKEIRFAKNLLSLTKARLTHGFTPFRLLWIAKHRHELFLKDSAAVTLKRILFTAVGLPLARKIWKKS